jgi:hypothetical protein
MALLATRRRRLWGAAGLALTGVGVLLLILRAAGTFDPPRRAPVSAGRLPFDVLYRPRTFVSRGKPVELRYEIVCPLTKPPEPGFCVPGGTLHVRRSVDSDFHAIPLTVRRAGLASALVPADYTAGAGFDYYVELHDERGQVRTVPQAGPDAPQRSWAVDRWTTFDLGTHRFGRTRPAETIVAAKWGAGLGRLGLRRGIGASAFAVRPDDAIVVLDQANRRLALYAPDDSARPEYVRIRFLGGEGDLAIAPDGTVYVLDTGRPKEHVFYVRSYSRRLRPLAETRVAEAPSDRLQAGTNGATVHGFPSEEWLPLGHGAQLLGPDEQQARARPAPTFAGGKEVAVLAAPREARFALFRGQRLLGRWRVRSKTPLGEVQLAEPFGNGLLVVLRVHTGRRAEWDVLKLTPDGVAKRFTVDAVEWAGSAPASRFRLRGQSLYSLQSGRSGVRILRYALSGN